MPTVPTVLNRAIAVMIIGSVMSVLDIIPTAGWAMGRIGAKRA
ncbi:hypothetical protein [Kitasatospora sp. NBC_01266]|nr:hypothetical protein [Kitasatospora sp. NBC_01266]